MFSTYDQWKLRSPDDDRPDPEFACTECDDAGCPECCEPQPITLDDLDELGPPEPEVNYDCDPIADEDDRDRYEYETGGKL